ncbi:MAG: TIR domain-containing protein [Bryobacteraceae bacterium]
MIKIFISYADEDTQFCHELDVHLATLRNSGRVQTWTVEKIEPGVEWATETLANFEAAQVVVLLISPPFLDSIPKRPEFARAMERHRNGTAKVVPIIIRPCDWKDGKIDKLHCLCRDKPVSLYGKDRTDHDSAWLYVVEELKRLVDRGSPGSAPPAPPRESSALPYLCDRVPQEMGFIQRFSTTIAPEPQFYFLPGPDGEMHPSFLSRVCGWTLPEELLDRGKYGRESIVRVPAQWLQGAPKGREMELAFVKQKLASALSIHPNLEGRILIVEHNLYVKWWSDEMVALLREYIRHWTAAKPAGGNPTRTLVFFHVVYPAGTTVTPKDSILAKLEELAREMDGTGCSAGLLDALEPVEREHVDDWITTYQGERRLEGVDLLAKLFSGAPALPMIRVEPRLQEFVDQN